jgi:1-Cys peroxiredoxin 6
MGSLSRWKKGKVGHLVFPPSPTPVCTTEIGRLAMKQDELHGMDCLIVPSPIPSSRTKTGSATSLLIAKTRSKSSSYHCFDADRAISGLRYDRRSTSDEQAPPLTIRTLYHQPRKQAYAVLNYPACPDVIWTKSSAASRLCSYPEVHCHPANWPNKR